MTTERILLFVHYNKVDSLDGHVIYQLGQMRPYYTKIILISNSKLSNIDTQKLSGFYDEFVQRENSGYDFAAWRDGIKKIGWKKLETYDNVTLMNDTCFGPIQPMEEVFRKMEGRRDIGFWGITMHNGSSVGMPGTNGPVPKHLQSYFMTFSREVVASDKFHKFWRDVIDADNVEYVIQNYETRLTGILERQFAYDALIKHNDTLPDITYLKPRNLIAKGLPFVKTKSLIECGDFITPWGLAHYIGRFTDYPVRYMYKYINKDFSRYARRSLKKCVYYIRECLSTKR